MELQREKPKKKKRIITEFPQVNREDIKDEFHSWEDLKTQQGEIELLYPLAPDAQQSDLYAKTSGFYDTLGVQYLVKYPQNVIGRETEDHSKLLTMVPESPLDYKDIIKNHKVVYPSAPLLVEENLQFEFETISDSEIDILENLYQNDAQDEFKSTVNVFRNNQSSSGLFYQKVKEYESSIYHLQDSKRKVKNLIALHSQCLFKLWSLEKSLGTAKVTCPDGWSVSTNFQNETPIFHCELIANFTSLQRNLLKESMVSIPKDTFMKMVSY